MPGGTPRWVKIWSLWTLFGLITAVQTHYRYEMAGRPFSWFDSILAEVSFAWIWALITPLVLWMAQRFPLERGRWWMNIFLHLACAVTFGIASKGFGTRRS